MKKECIKCKTVKPFSDFYINKNNKDGLFGKCKECTKTAVRERENGLKLNPEWQEKERTRAREKYYRLNYKGRNKPNRERKKETIAAFNKRYPEKVYAWNRSCNLKPAIDGNHLHHWSYLPEHAKDVIELTPALHQSLHRFLIYDQERMQYRRIDNLELLHTKELHLSYLNELKIN